MKTAIADTEANGLLDEVTELHSLCYHIQENDERVSAYGDTLNLAIERMAGMDQVWFHNAFGYDVPMLKKVRPQFSMPISKIRDSLILSKLMCPNIRNIDCKIKGFPRGLIGSHGLEAWGYRLGKHKGDYKKEMEALGLDPWASWNPHMQDYCNNDVDVTVALVELLQKEGIPERASELEHWFAYVCSKMESTGFLFDIEKAKKLVETIRADIAELDAEILPEVPDWYAPAGPGVFIPKRTQGLYTKEAPLTKIVLKKFNPNSRQQVAEKLVRLFGWEPFEFTPKGSPKVDEENLKYVEHPIGKRIAKRFILQKRISQIAEGETAWFKKVKRDGRIHGRIDTLGARTGRCTHSGPNMAQIPSVGSPFGKECRELFIARPGYVVVGADASGIELRCLAHHMAEFDGGEYIKALLEGDIHTVNQEAAGLPTRDNAKTFIYGFLYGAGSAKIGKIINGTEADGQRLKDQFLEGLPALKAVRDAVQKQVKEEGLLIGLDGRKLLPGALHASLNTRLQSDGGLLCKQAAVNVFKRLTKEGYVWGDDWAMVAHVHDEYQLEVKEELADYVAEVAVWGFEQAGRDFNWRCRLDGEAKIGNNWAETH